VDKIINIVDVTNYVMIETGQPLHAFDYDLLHGRKIVVRAAAEGEVFTTLDGAERKLTGGMLLICDGERPVALAGVMGGQNSEVSQDTVNVFLESAYFNPGSVRRTARKLGLHSEASRFERGTDPEACRLRTGPPDLLPCLPEV
jgi:phenylalanyl-tRNA synthetase beta chain